MEQVVPIKRALISVSDKTGLKSLAKFLVSRGIEIVATSGTAKFLGDIPTTPIETVTGNPEAFSGRMKTISFQVASALLYRRDLSKDKEEAKALHIQPIDLLVGNLYPFEEVKEKKVSDEEILEQIDIGGPTMLRAAAKNFQFVTVLSHSSNYALFTEELERNDGFISLETRKSLAVKAFQLTAHYETVIAQELTNRFTKEKIRYLSLFQGKELRYGENSHQRAHHYRCRSWKEDRSSITSATIVQGKPLSYNNLLDADSAYRTASDAWKANNSNGVAVAVVKHGNPCGLSVSHSPCKALNLAWNGDPISAFGSVICFTSEVDVDVANYLQDRFIEIIIAPTISPEALNIFSRKKNMRILLCPPREKQVEELMFRSISGGILLQNEDEGLDESWSSVTKMKFPKSKNTLVHFGIMAAKHLKSNSISLVSETKDKDLQLVGTGMGQPNRLDSIRMLAGPRMLEKKIVEEIILVSDAFFPFTDAIDAIKELGIKYIVQPGGSIRDQEIVDVCDNYGIAMLFTGRRHFRH